MKYVHNNFIQKLRAAYHFCRSKTEKETYHIPHPPILMTAAAEMHSTKMSRGFSSWKYCN